MNFQKLDEIGADNEPVVNRSRNVQSPQSSYSQPPQISGRFLSQFSPRFFIALVILMFLLLLGFLTLIAFVVKCDERKIIDIFKSRNSSDEKAYSALENLIKQKELEMDEEYKSKKIRWIEGILYEPKILEPTGCERLRNDNLLLYVARTSYLNGTVVGKFCPYMGTMYFGYNGVELSTQDFELLVFPRGSLSWIPVMDSVKLPEEKYLVFGGEAPGTKEATYICRFYQDGHVFLGKYLGSENKCLAAYRAEELQSSSFEILALNALGTMMGVQS